MDEQTQTVPSEEMKTEALTPSTPEQPSQPENTRGYGQGKTNWIKWIVIYGAIAVVVYGIIWYFFLRGGGNTPY